MAPNMASNLRDQQYQQPVSVKFPVEIRKELEEAVQRSGVNRSQLIVQSVTYFLRNVDPSNTEIQRRVPETSSEGSTTGGVDEQARKALTALLGRTQKVEDAISELQESIQVIKKSADLNFGLIEKKADQEEFIRTKLIAESMETRLNVLMAALKGDGLKSDVHRAELATTVEQVQDTKDQGSDDFSGQFEQQKPHLDRRG